MLAGIRQTFAATDELPVSSVSLSAVVTVNVAVLLSVTHALGTETVQVYWYVVELLIDPLGIPEQVAPDVGLNV